MTYAYSSESSRMDFPNPFRIANVFLFLIALFTLVTGFSLLFMSREIVSQKFEMKAAIPLIIGVCLLFYSFRVFVQLGRQLKFYFGRGQPDGLAPELAATQTGTSQEAQGLSEVMRQGALSYPVPEGALNGLLYSFAKNLIYAPEPVQNMAQAQFFNFTGALSTLICFGLGVFALSDDSGAGKWVGIFFYFFTLWLLLRPMYRAGDAKSKMGSTQLLVMIVIAVMGPVLLRLIGGKLPNITCFSINQQVFWLLSAALLAEGLYLVALLRQSTKAPQTTIACEQTSLSMNDSPTQLMNEMNRRFQEQWVERIPNRVYERKEPEIEPANKSGAFQAALMEETQPVPPSHAQELDLGTCAAEPKLRWLLALNMLGILFTMGGCFTLIVFGNNFHVGKDFLSHLLVKDPAMCSSAHDLLGILSTGSALVLLGSFCAKAANTLWGRFDFESDLVWVEMQGHYDTARMDYGNLMTDRLKTERDMITIEGMTLRVWATRLHTVVFAADSNSARQNKRYVIGMFGLDQTASRWISHLKDFVAAQSLLITPTSEHDAQKAQQLQQLNELGHSQQPAFQAEYLSSAPGMPMVDPRTGAFIVAPLGGKPQSAPANPLGTPSPILTSQSMANHVGNNQHVTSTQTAQQAAKPVINQKKRFCAECGHPNDPSAKFCVDCGSKMA